MQTVFCTTSFEGIHNFPAAPPEVAYLASPHRHIFNVRAEVEVFDDDREVEFIMMKHEIEQRIRMMLDEGVWNMGSMSCEKVAKLISRALCERYCTKEVRFISVSVDEDSENGATYSFTYGPRSLGEKKE